MTNRVPLFVLLAAAAAAVAAAATPGSAAASPTAADEIVVIAQRTGIPVWRVNSASTTLVLIGSIGDVAKETKWDAAALNQALLKADRVMFPDRMGISASAFSIPGYLIKWRRQASLPKGQSLATLLPPAHFQRLVALQKRGLLKPGFERKHPLHLAFALREVAIADKVSRLSASYYVRRAARTNRIAIVPITSVRAKSVADDFFATPPRAYLPCLMDSVALIEAGPWAIRARSDAWAQRRVSAVLASPADRVQESCVPPAFEALKSRSLNEDVRTLLDQKPVTIAVIELRTLARSNGILDHLSARGYDVRGPRWKN